MNAPHLHLILNHVPTIGTAIALGLLLLSLLRRQEALTRVSLEVFCVLTLITLPAYLSGVATALQLEKMEGISLDAIASFGAHSFRENILFTHRGLSGPAILQISSYWRQGETITLDLAPGQDAEAWLKERKRARPRAEPKTVLGELFPARLAQTLRTPVCLDETLRDARAARQIIALQGPKVWNIKVHRVGGLSEVCHLYRLAEEYGAQLWAGTMPESGIGSQAALAAASLPLFVYPSDLEPSSRWFGRNGDVIKLTMDKQGRMAVPRQSCGRLMDPGRFRALTSPLP